MTALAWAAHQGYEQVVDVLLKAGANPDIQDNVCYFLMHIINTVVRTTLLHACLCRSLRGLHFTMLLNMITWRVFRYSLAVELIWISKMRSVHAWCNLLV